MKNLIIASIIVLFSTSVFAGSCPMMAKQVGDKIAQAQQLHDDAIAAVSYTHLTLPTKA